MLFVCVVFLSQICFLYVCLFFIFFSAASNGTTGDQDNSPEAVILVNLGKKHAKNFYFKKLDRLSFQLVVY